MRRERIGKTIIQLCRNLVSVSVSVSDVCPKTFITELKTSFRVKTKITKIWNLIVIKETLIWIQFLSTNTVYRLHDRIFVFINIFFIFFFIVFIIIFAFIVFVIKEGLRDKRDKAVVVVVGSVERIGVGHCFVVSRVWRIDFFGMEII